MNTRLTRAKQLIEARMADPAAAASIETAIATDLLGPDTSARDADVRPLTYPQHGYLSPMAAAEAFGQAFERGLANLAANLNVKVPKRGKYHPLFATPTLFREVWRARQVVDELGIPYGFYVEHALLRWHELGNKRMPRPSQLTSPDIAMHVIECWADPAFRWNYPVLDGWDPRFDADSYCGDAMQDRALTLIERRVADAKSTGRDPAAALAGYLDVHITHDEAERRFGADLVVKALELVAVAVAEQGAMYAVTPDAALTHVLQNI